MTLAKGDSVGYLNVGIIKKLYKYYKITFKTFKYQGFN